MQGSQVLSDRSAERFASIDDGVSSYLDLVRAFAALVVVLSHLLPILFGIYAVPGNDAVIMFFVISGYVIAYAHEQRDFTADRFVINRLARLWSVLIPSLVLSAIAAAVVKPGIAIMFAPPSTGLLPFMATALQNALFLSQNWSWYNPATYNEPTWSLAYEAWYYAIFAAFVFTPRPWRWHVTAIVACLAGPAIVALIPCWLIGTWLYYRRNALRLPLVAASILFVACVVLYGVTYRFDLNTHSRAWLSALTFGHSYRLRASTGMLGDIINACLFGGTIIAVQNMGAANRALAAMRWFAKKISSRTFSCYLYHMPIFAILYGGLGFGRDSRVAGMVCIVTVVCLCVLLGGVTEARVGSWRTGLRTAVQSLRPGAMAG